MSNKSILSTGETLIMKVIWDQKKDVTITDLVSLLCEHYEKEYKRSTVVTFLTRLSDKRFISSRRDGRMTYIHAEKTEEDYRTLLANQQLDYWFQGKLPSMVSALTKDRHISKEDRARLREMIEEMDREDE